jgi:CBS domain-containing protein
MPGHLQARAFLKEAATVEAHRTYSLRARDIMNSAFLVVSPLTTIYDVVMQMIGCNCQVAIIDRTDDSDAYGMVTYEQIAAQVITKSLQPSRVRVADIMIKPLIVVNPNLRLPFIAQLFSNTNIHHAPVIEEHRLAGVISTSDLVKALVMDGEAE